MRYLGIGGEPDLRLRYYRELKNMSQEDLGRIIGVNQNTISQWETDMRSPRITKLKQLASVLGCTVDELLGGQ